MRFLKGKKATSELHLQKNVTSVCAEMLSFPLHVKHSYTPLSSTCPGRCRLPALSDHAASGSRPPTRLHLTTLPPVGQVSWAVSPTWWWTFVMFEWCEELVAIGGKWEGMAESKSRHARSRVGLTHSLTNQLHSMLHKSSFGPPTFN